MTTPGDEFCQQMTRELTGRLVRLETKLDEMDKLFQSTRDREERDKSAAKEVVDKHFEATNNFRQQMNAMAGTFVTEKSMEAKIDVLRLSQTASNKILYILVGGLAAFEVILRWVLK